MILLKRVLITGANSYVGTNVENWLMREPDKYYVETLDMKDPNWKNFDFSRFDVVFHVAGIAHVSTKKSMKDLYFKVNRDLTIETATKAKESGVKQFIFMSSMIVYSSKETRITLETKPNPDNFYGLSKLQAEGGIEPLHSKDFKVCILRPPMIYGSESKGNFLKLLQLSNMTFLFPKYINTRSALYIVNLCMYIKSYIDLSSFGVHHPKNYFDYSTYEVVKVSRELKGKKTWLTRFFNPFIWVLVRISGVFNKMFGNFYYDFDNELEFKRVEFETSMKDTIKGI